MAYFFAVCLLIYFIARLVYLLVTLPRDLARRGRGKEERTWGGLTCPACPATMGGR